MYLVLLGGPTVQQLFADLQRGAVTSLRGSERPRGDTALINLSKSLSNAYARESSAFLRHLPEQAAAGHR